MIKWEGVYFMQAAVMLIVMQAVTFHLALQKPMARNDYEKR